MKKVLLATLICIGFASGCKDGNKESETMTVTGEISSSNLYHKSLGGKPVTALVLIDGNGLRHYVAVHGEQKDLLDAQKITVTFSKKDRCAYTEETLVETRPDGSKVVVTKGIDWMTILEYKVLASKPKEDEYPK